MKKITTLIEGHSGSYEFDVFENFEPIEMNDYYLFNFGGAWCVGHCNSENEKYEINPNDRVKDNSKIDLVTDFWKKCYKIKNTNFDLSLI